MNDKSCKTRSGLLLECNKLIEENKDLKRELRYVTMYFHVLKSNVIKNINNEIDNLKKHIDNYLARHKDEE